MVAMEKKKTLATMMALAALATLAATGEGTSLQAEVEAKLQAKMNSVQCEYDFEKVGNGFCREFENYADEASGQGEYVKNSNVVTREECEQLCKDTYECSGYEYDARRHVCEVHTGEVESYKPKYGVVCYKVVQSCDHYDTECKYKTIGQGYCRRGEEMASVPGSYKTFCSSKAGFCTERTCKEECSEKDWCYGYEFQVNMEATATSSAEIGRCELYTQKMDSVKGSQYATCKFKKNKKRCQKNYDDSFGPWWY